VRYVGIDVCKQKADISIREQEGQIVERLTVDNGKRGFAQLEQHLREGDRLGLEASTYAYPIHDHFLTKGFEVWMGDPGRMRAVWDTDHKNDVQDADEISDLLRVGRFPRAYVPTPQILRLRNLLRADADIGVERARIKNRVMALLAAAGVKPPHKGSSLFQRKGVEWLGKPHFHDERDAILRSFVIQLTSLDERRHVLDGELAKVAVEWPGVQDLMTTTGIDYRLALTIAAEVGDMGRFPDLAHFRSYAGCAPRWGQSGARRWSNGTTRRCNKRLKWALGLATNAAIKSSNPVTDYYQKQLRKTGKAGQALSRARTKMCNTVYAVLRNSQTCTWGNPRTFGEKRNRMMRRARRAGAT
jgi:transposase